MKVLPSRNLGRHMAHPVFQEGMHADILSRALADIARYRHLPQNAFERVQLLKSILISHRVYHLLLVSVKSLVNKYKKGRGYGAPFLDPACQAAMVLLRLVCGALYMPTTSVHKHCGVLIISNAMWIESRALMGKALAMSKRHT